MPDRVENIEEKYLLENRINGLLLRSEAFFNWCESYRDLYYKYHLESKSLLYGMLITADFVKLLPLFSNLYFNDCLLCLDTLLSTKNEQISLRRYLSLIKKESSHNEMKGLVEQLIQKYKLSPISTIRHTIVAHKNAKTSGDVETHFINFIEEEFFPITKELLEELRQILSSYFTQIPGNNNFGDMYLKSHNKLLEIFEDEIKQTLSNSKLKNLVIKYTKK